jgi:hypothetical protein
MPRFTPHAVVLVQPPPLGQIHCSAAVGTSCLRIDLAGNSFTYLRQAMSKLADLHPFWRTKAYGLAIVMKPDFCVEHDLEGRVVAIHDTPAICPIAYMATVH